MASVTVIRPGYAFVDSAGKHRAGGSISLVRAANLTLLVDTGNPTDRDLLLHALAHRALHPFDITHVLCTHGHADHVGNNGLFPHATFLLGADLSRGDEFLTLDFSLGPLRLADDVQVIATPGHTPDDLTAIVETPDWTIAIVGDLFEHADDERDHSWLPLSHDAALQAANRRHILDLADAVVPGHGELFFTRRGASHARTLIHCRDNKRAAPG